MRDTLRDTNRRLEEQVNERTVALQTAQQAEERLQAAHEELETRVVERTAALENASHEIGARALQQAAVASLGQSALSNGHLAGLMNAAAELVADTLSVEFTSVLQLSDEGDNLLLCAGRGWPEGFLGKYTAAVDQRTPAGYALAAREPIIIEDLERDKRFGAVPHLSADRIRSLVLLTSAGKSALRGAGRVHSPIAAVHCRRRTFPSGRGQRAGRRHRAQARRGGHPGNPSRRRKAPTRPRASSFRA